MTPGGAARAAGLHGDEALDAAHRRGRRGGARGRRRHRRRARARAALLGALDQGLPRRSSRRRSRAAPSSSSSRAGTTSRASSRSSPTGSAGTDRHVVFTAHSLPARILDEGDPYRDQLLETARLVAEAAGVEDWSFSFQSESPTGRAVARPGHPRPPRRAARGRDGPRARLPRRVRRRTIWRSAGTSTPRRRSARPSSGWISSGSRCRTPTRRSWTCSRGSSRRALAGPEASEPAMIAPGRIVVERVSQRFRVSERPYRTLKDSSSRAAAAATSEVWALQDVSLAGRARRGARARRPQRLGQDDAAPARLRHLQADLAAGSRSAGASARCSSSAPASTPTSPAARTST